MITAISRRLLDSSNTAVSTSDVASAINDAVRFWKYKRFHFNTASADVEFLTAAEVLADADPTNSYSLTLPDDFLVDLGNNALSVIDSGIRYPLKKIDPEVFDAIGTTGDTGRPQYYCLRGSSLEVKPYPDREYDGRLRYLKDYDDFATDGTQNSLSNDFHTEADNLIRSDALARLHGELRQDEKMEKVYTNRANSEYNNLLSMARKKNGSNSLTVYD